MIKIKDIFVLILLFVVSSNGFAQIGVTYYSLDVIGFNTPIVKIQGDNITSEIKTFTNTEMKELSFELDVLYQFEAKEYHRFSLGVGLKTDPFTDGGDGTKFLMPIALEVFPWPELKRFSFILELAPKMSIDENYSLRSLFGLRYILAN